MSRRHSQRILIIGAGGREHALGWKLTQSESVGEIYFAPGNAGTAEIGKNIHLSVDDVDGIVNFVLKNNIDLTVIGPEKALACGIVDALQAHGKDVFGPTVKASQLEISKAFATQFVQENDIPHPQSLIFTDPQEARVYANRSPEKIVIKASGLANGKGVFLPDSQAECDASIEAISNGTITGIPNDAIIIQERLIGREASIIAVTDGTRIVPFIPAQDYKRVHDGDKGPNTGGMGSIAPSELGEELMNEIQTKILQPTIDAMAKRGTPYKGVLYAGLMLTDDGPKVIEYNARFGDPETQPLMMLLTSDLYALMKASINGTLAPEHIQFKNGASVCVVVSAKGYPGNYDVGHKIHGLETIMNNDTVCCFHAGTGMKGDSIVTAGGRVLGITAYGKDRAEASSHAYSIIEKGEVWFDGMHYRKDIGKI